MATRSHQTEEDTFLSIVNSCDDFPFGPVPDAYYQLYLADDDSPHGYLIPETVDKMPWTERFTVQHSHPRSITVLDSSKGRNTAAAINAAFAELVNTCIERDLFHVLCGRHSEPFAIPSARFDQPVYVERWAAQLFGVTHRGAHLVAYTNTCDSVEVWIARRSPHLYTSPGMLDTTVAGGVKSGVPPFQTITEEADEEASLPTGLVQRLAKCRGCISHMNTTGLDFPGEQGLVIPDYIYVYDMELPRDVIPRPHDEEVQSFSRMTIDDLKTALRRKEFKPDSASVLIDFLVRHNFINPANEPDFVEITIRLHRKLPFRT